ncbi:MAG: hypothetical protein CMP10_03635 [Zetaproteobacteria bacterium]|nr:hypothetical protein [Pseudobdellovibrionaceae bacterium]
MLPEFVVINPDKISQIIQIQQVKKTWLAAEVGVDRNTLRRWLKGEIRKIRWSHGQKLAKLLEHPLEEIINKPKNNEVLTSRDAREDCARDMLDGGVRQALINTGKFGLADNVLQCALKITEDKVKQAALFRDLAVTNLYKLDLADAEKFARQSMNLAANGVSDHLFQESKSILGRVMIQQNIPLGIQMMEEVAEVAVDWQKTLIQSSKVKLVNSLGPAVLANLGAAYSVRGDLERSKASLNHSLDWMAKVEGVKNTPTRLAITHLLCLETALLEGDSFQARVHLQAAIEQEEKVTSKLIQTLINFKSLRLDLMLGQFDQVMASLDLVDEKNMALEVKLELLLVRCLALIHQNKTETAKEMFHQHRRDFLTSHLVYWKPIHCYLARASAGHKDAELECRRFFKNVGATDWLALADSLGGFALLAARLFNLPK